MTSPGTSILVFKLLAGLAVAAATALAALAAGPARAPLAVALVGLNPVLVVHTVGGGHVDGLLAAPLAGAAALAVTRPGPSSPRSYAVTGLLAAACLLKTVVAPVLVLWLVHVARTGRGRTLAAHVGVVAAGAVATGAPYAAGWRTVRPFATLGGVEAWASPSHLVGRFLPAEVAEAAFLVAFVALAWLLARRADPSDPAVWGTTLLLLALCLPYLLPWYAAWFAPFLALLADDAVLVAGTLAAGVLALTLVPADPFHGLTAPAVIDGVHYGAASVLLVVLLVVAARVLGRPVSATGLTAQTAE